MPAHRLVLPLLLALSITAPAYAHCCLSTEARGALEQWKSSGFQIDDDGARNKRALELTDCLGDADPALRDGIAFEALSTWMRSDLLDGDTLRSLMQALLAQLDGDDADGFAKPFAALVLSEVARTDRIRAWMTDEERARMVDAAGAYLRSVRDYRGYVDGEGWRHGVAHGADWAMQLALNGALEPAQTSALLAAIAAQVMPSDGHVYAFGEPSRLARAAAYALARGDVDPTTAASWMAELISALGPRPDSDPQALWWMRRSNLENFLAALGFMTSGSDSEPLATVAAAARDAMRKLP